MKLSSWIKKLLIIVKFPALTIFGVHTNKLKGVKMPFPCREIYDFPPSSPYGEMEIKTLPNGKCSSRLVLSRKPLPSCENFALDKILAAGLPLEKVSTIIKSSGSIPLELVQEDSVDSSEKFNS